MQYNSNTDYYEATEDGHLVQVDSDVFAEMLQEGMSEDELLETTTWTGSTPMHGVLIDGVAQD